MATRYSGRIAETISDEMSVSSEHVPSSSTVPPTRCLSRPVVRFLRIALLSWTVYIGG